MTRRSTQRIRTKLTISSIATLLAMLALAMPAAAQPPPGQGLISVADEGVSNLVCSDPSISAEDVVVTPGGGTATWLLDGRMFVIQSISVEGTITTPDGPMTASFAKSYGQKAGLAAETITCTFDQTGPGFEASGTVTLVRVQ
jgi:hypothetical protein